MTTPSDQVPDWMLELADIITTMRVMTEDEAKMWGIPLEERHNYIRVERIKAPDDLS
jgi:hypothetical protein